jgi:ubiquinone/menaquinone biosynthesis C-methylase UbiE
LRKAFKKCDWDRYAVAERLVGSGKRVLDIGCRDGHMLLKFKDKYQELYGIDISPSHIKEAKEKVKKFSLKIFRNLILLKEMQIILFFFQIIILILLFV